MPSCSAEFFRFSHRPFRGTPDPEDYVAVDPIEQEVQRLAAAVVDGDGISVLTAVPGAGKTLVCQQLQARVGDRFEAVLLSSSGFGTRRALLQAVLFALGQSYESCSEQELRLGVLNYARNLATSREGLVLIIDEAHLLNVRLLEELRCLTNHSQGGHPLIRVVLCGQLPLEDALVDPALEALNYRITCHATLEPLSMQESAQLIAGRLQRAGRNVTDIFTPEALETICRVSDGNPRCLSQLCDEALRIAAEREQVPVPVETVQVALHDLKQLPLQWNDSAIDQPPTGPAPPVGNPAATGFEDPMMSVAEAFNDGQFNTDKIQSGAVDDDTPLGWSEAVSTVELGADCDLCEPAPATAGWSSFEPASGWEASSSASNEECVADGDLADSELPVFAQSNEIPHSVATAEAVQVRTIDTMISIDPKVTRGDSETGRIAADAVTVDPRPCNGFVEVSVDDAYAALDARKGRTAAVGEADAFDQILRPTAARQSQQSGKESAVGSPLTERRCLADEELDELRVTGGDPEQRIEAASSARSGSASQVDSEAASSSIEWQSAGDCRDYDVLEPGGEPQWDSHGPEPDSNTAQTTNLPPRSADNGANWSQGEPPASMKTPVRRPYARLFSRARQHQS